MATHNKIIETFKNISIEKKIPSDDVSFLKDNLKLMQEHLNASEKKVISAILEILSKDAIIKPRRKKLIDNITNVTKIVTAHKNVFIDNIEHESTNEISDDEVEDSDDEVENSIEKNINDDNQNVDEKKSVRKHNIVLDDNEPVCAFDNRNITKIKSELDLKVGKYAKFDDDHESVCVFDNRSIDEIETELDSKVGRYSKFNYDHPMEYVTYYSKKKSYHIMCKGYDGVKDLNTYNKSINTACQKVKDFITNKSMGKISNFIVSKKEHFKYKNNYFVIYICDGLPFFDIWHVIMSLGLVTSSNNDKFDAFREKISGYVWHKNKFGGYVCRELINDGILYDIMFSSNSDFAKKFKKNVSNLLVTLGKNGKIAIKNDDFVYNNDVPNKASGKNDEIVPPMTHQNTTDTTSLTLHKNNSNMMQLVPHHKSADISGSSETSSKFRWLELETENEYLKHGDSNDTGVLLALINQFKLQSVSQCFDRLILYAFVTNIRRTHGFVVVKFGYTDDFLARWDSLKSEFGKDIYPIGMKRICNRSVEENFHKLLKKRFPGSNDPLTIKGIKKTELYKFCLSMMIDFDNVVEDHSQVLQEMALTSAQETVLREMEKAKKLSNMIFVIQNNMRTLISHINNPDVANHYVDAHHKHLHYQTECQHDIENKKVDIKNKKVDLEKESLLINKEKDIEMAKLKNEYLVIEKDKEIELKNKEIELKSKEIERIKLEKDKENERIKLEKDKENERIKLEKDKDIELKNKDIEIIKLKNEPIMMDKELERLKLEIELRKLKSTESQEKNDEPNVRGANKTIPKLTSKSTKIIKK